MNPEFTISAESFSLKHTAKSASSRHYCYVDVLVGGVIVEHFGHEHVLDIRSHFTVKLPEGTHKITIYLLWLFGMRVCVLELSGGATFAPVKRGLRLFAFGDSITQGYDAQYPSQSYIKPACGQARFLGGPFRHRRRVLPPRTDHRRPFGTDGPHHGRLRHQRLAFFHRLTQPPCELLRGGSCTLARFISQHPIAVILPLWRGDSDRARRV